MNSPSDPSGYSSVHASAVEAELAALLDLHGEDRVAAMRALERRDPELARRVRQWQQWLEERGLLEDSASFPERLGDFHLIERLGGGGMGVVYRARQTSLEREVALKLIRPEHLYFPGAKDRFSREATAVARLRHPAIVPVHAFGEEAGVPYIAMELVDGLSLDRVLQQLAGADPSKVRGETIWDLLDPGAPASMPELFAGRLADVACRIWIRVLEALTHAHHRGVVHRDIKPGNVMLTRDGHVRLLDFGLASFEMSSSLTQSGSRVGSLRYMSPEALDGHSSQIDERSDVYSCATSLWECLCLVPLWPGPGPAEIRKQMREPLPRLRSHSRDASRDLEVVLAHALEPGPDDRYQNATALRDDLLAALEFRPIAARPSSPALKLRRWIRRQPALAAAVVLGILLLVPTPLLLWMLQVNANAAIRAEKDAADRARTLAETSLEETLAAVRFLLREFGSNDLALVPRMQQVRRAILEEAVRRIDALAIRHGDHRPLLLERAEARLGLAIACSNVLEREEALEHYAEAARLFDRLAAADPADAELRIRAREADARRVGVMLTSGRIREGLELAQRTLAACSPPTTMDEAPRELLVTRAKLLGALGTAAFERREFDEALRLLDEAENLLAALKARRVVNNDYFHALAGVRLMAARTAFVMPASPEAERRRTESLAALREVMADIRQQAAGRPELWSLRSPLVSTGATLGEVLALAGDHDGAAAAYLGSVEDAESIATENPDLIQIWAESLRARERAAFSLARCGRTQEASAQLDTGLQRGQDLLAKERLTPRGQLYLASLHYAKARSLPSEDREGALAHYLAAVRIGEARLGDARVSPFYFQMMASSHFAAALLLQKQSPEEARPLMIRALELCATGVRDTPDPAPMHRIGVGVALGLVPLAWQWKQPGLAAWAAGRGLQHIRARLESTEPTPDRVQRELYFIQERCRALATLGAHEKLASLAHEALERLPFHLERADPQAMTKYLTAHPLRALVALELKRTDAPAPWRERALELARLRKQVTGADRLIPADRPRLQQALDRDLEQCLAKLREGASDPVEWNVEERAALGPLRDDPQLAVLLRELGI